MDGRQNKIAIVHPFLIRVDAMKTETKPKTKITTEYLVSLDCTKEENKIKLNKFLWKVKPVAKLAEREGIKTQPKQKPEKYAELLKKADAESKETDGEDWEDEEAEEDDEWEI